MGRRTRTKGMRRMAAWLRREGEKRLKQCERVVRAMQYGKVAPELLLPEWPLKRRKRKASKVAKESQGND